MPCFTRNWFPELNDTDERNKWLYTSSQNFSTVFEAIEYLEALVDN